MRHPPGSPRTVFVASPDEELMASCARLATAGILAVCPLAGAPALARLGALAASDVLILDEALLLAGPAVLTADDWLDRDRTLLVTSRDAAATASLLAEHPRLCHVLARDGSRTARRLSTAVAAVLGDAGPGPALYLAPGTGVASGLVASTAQMQAWLARVTDAAAAVGGFRDLPAVVTTIASELVMNAVFNAPHDARLGTPRYRDRPRHERLELARGEEVAVAFGHDDQSFVVCVRDNFGALARGTLVSGLVRAATAGAAQVRLTGSGAGVGLYMVLSSAAELAIRVAPGRSTEVVAGVGLTKRYRDFARSGHSLALHFAPAEDHR